MKHKLKALEELIDFATEMEKEKYAVRRKKKKAPTAEEESCDEEPES